MPLTFAETPLYYRDSQGQYHRILSGADMTGYRTAAAQDVIDVGFAKTNEVGIVINGKRPARNATAGQYVIVRNSTISGITDGLYVVKRGYTLSPSTDVTAASLSAVNIGGLNFLLSKIEDSGWQNVSTSAAFTTYGSSGYFRCRKVGNLVFVEGQLTPVSNIAGSSNAVSMGTLPTGFRPSGTVWVVCHGSGKNIWLGTVYTNGNVGIARYGVTEIVDIPAGAWLPFSFVFPVA